MRPGPATSSASRPRVIVYWRPGCPFCLALRRGLRRAGLEATEIDIWRSPEAAARVRQVTGGDETVPTVIVGEHALVNPSTAAVLAAAGHVPARRAPRAPVLARAARRVLGRPGSP